MLIFRKMRFNEPFPYSWLSERGQAAAHHHLCKARSHQPGTRAEMHQVEKLLEEIRLQSLEISTRLTHFVGKKVMFGGEIPGSSGTRSAAPGTGASSLAQPPRLSPAHAGCQPGQQLAKKCLLKKDFGHGYSSNVATMEPHAKCFFTNS